ncbi:MAG: DUF4386 family protein [Clostridiales bacterium]|nr:DUF4386 family protein [Clostridiales bacterium]
METSSKKDAKRAGFLYLAFVITCIFAGVVRANLIALGDASKTADLLNHSEWLLRISSVVDLISAVLFLVAAWHGRSMSFSSRSTKTSRCCSFF